MESNDIENIKLNTDEKEILAQEEALNSSSDDNEQYEQDDRGIAQKEAPSSSKAVVITVQPARKEHKQQHKKNKVIVDVGGDVLDDIGDCYNSQEEPSTSLSCANVISCFEVALNGISICCEVGCEATSTFLSCLCKVVCAIPAAICAED